MPSFCTLNGLNVLDGVIYIPRIGVWHADLAVDSFSPLSGQAVTIQMPSQAFVGKVTRSGTDVAKRLRIRVVGGNAGLSTVMTPKGYGFVPLSVPLNDALAAAGETLSATADQSILSTMLTAWSSMAAPASSQISSLLAVVPNAAWRVLIDGTIWVGFESWPSSSLPDTVLIRSEPETGRVMIASDAPGVLPGTTFSYLSPGTGQVSKQVSYVQHLIRMDEVRTVFYSE